MKILVVRETMFASTCSRDLKSFDTAKDARNSSSPRYLTGEPVMRKILALAAGFETKRARRFVIAKFVIFCGDFSAGTTSCHGSGTRTGEPLPADSVNLGIPPSARIRRSIEVRKCPRVLVRKE